MQKWKSVKKVSKIDPPWKRPKCQINGTFWHFAKSEPPGWALFRFQGVPRDPVLRPKSTWGVADGEFLLTFTFSPFSNCAFWWFLCFNILVKLSFLLGVTFFTIACYIVIRPYSKSGCSVKDVGEIHRRENES